MTLRHSELRHNQTAAVCLNAVLGYQSHNTRDVSDMCSGGVCVAGKLPHA